MLHYHQSLQSHFCWMKDFIGSPHSTLIELHGGCHCQLLSIDCLDTIDCLVIDPLTSVYEGIVIRDTIKKLAESWDFPINDIGGAPIGMSLQFLTIGVFREWLSKNQLPKGLYNRQEDFVNRTLYPYCVQKSLKGRKCFLNDFKSSEEVYGDIEKQAMDQKVKFHPAYQRNATERIKEFQKDPFNVSAYQYLMIFAQLSKITFNLRSHVHSIYNKRLQKIDNNIKKGASHAGKMLDLRIALHLRRGDACRHSLVDYAKVASPLDSPPQFSSHRLCYDTKVYMKALHRVQELAGPHRHITVYVATDHSQSLMDEIKLRFPDLYESMSWSYLDYSRDIFNYFGGQEIDVTTSFIESPQNKNKALLGETAIADIWHLSHGQVFIGHLGSRFGKMGWFQATARYNTFIPFYTVDGHSACCDIDEACGAMAQYVSSMENCLAIFIADSWSKFHTNETRSNYWSAGATQRKVASLAENDFRSRKQQMERQQ